MENFDRSQLPTTLHLTDALGTAVLTQVSEGARPGSVFRYTATLNANEDHRHAREDVQGFESPCAAIGGDLAVNGPSRREDSNEELAALGQLSKTAPRIADLDRLIKRHVVPQAYHDEPGWEDDAG